MNEKSSCEAVLPICQRAAGEILKPYSVGGSSRLGRWVGRSKGYAIRLSLAKQAAQQGHKGGADEGNTAARDKLLDALAFCLCVIKKQ